MPTSEKTIERRLVQIVRRAGGHSYKLGGPGDRGKPDRLVMFPGRSVVLVECKAPGKTWTKIQYAEALRLRGLGFRVELLNELLPVDWEVQVRPRTGTGVFGIPVVEDAT